jgi:hypothetical protein
VRLAIELHLLDDDKADLAFKQGTLDDQVNGVLFALNKFDNQHADNPLEELGERLRKAEELNMDYSASLQSREAEISRLSALLRSADVEIAKAHEVLRKVCEEGAPVLPPQPPQYLTYPSMQSVSPTPSLYDLATRVANLYREAAVQKVSVRVVRKNGKVSTFDMDT